MHELSYVTELYKRLIEENKQITDVYITVSSSSGIEADSFVFYWNSIIKTSKLTNTTLHITKTPHSLQCINCQHTFITPDEDSLLFPCPNCKSHKTIVIDQPSVTINKITYEENNYHKRTNS